MPTPHAMRSSQVPAAKIATRVFRGTGKAAPPAPTTTRQGPGDEVCGLGSECFPNPGINPAGDQDPLIPAPHFLGRITEWKEEGQRKALDICAAFAWLTSVQRPHRTTRGPGGNMSMAKTGSWWRNPKKYSRSICSTRRVKRKIGFLSQATTQRRKEQTHSTPLLKQKEAGGGSSLFQRMPLPKTRAHSLLVGCFSQRPFDWFFGLGAWRCSGGGFPFAPYKNQGSSAKSESG